VKDLKFLIVFLLPSCGPGELDSENFNGNTTVLPWTPKRYKDSSQD
jgi:hypothetical protein